jgi:6-phosphogluconolactonase/glucosamine-6-phosphate isomerase/deaminase
MEVKRYSTKQEAKKEGARKLNQLLDAHSHVPTLFLSSGGSPLELLDDIIIFPVNLTVGVPDERFSGDPRVNNFAQLAGTPFFEKAKEHGAYFIDTRVQQGEELGELALRMESAWKTWKQEHPGGRIIITQGVGPDGHTEGIMPFPKDEETFRRLFLQEERWVVGYDAKEKNEYPLRVTCTLPFLRMVDHSVLYMVGENKRDAFFRMLATEGSLWEAPCRIVQEMKNVKLFTDIVY